MNDNDGNDDRDDLPPFSRIGRGGTRGYRMLSRASSPYRNRDRFPRKRRQLPVAELLGMAPIRVYEVATFYTMFNLRPVGKHFFQICTTTPCWLRGSDEVVRACERKLGITIGETTPDGQFTLAEVECLGACVNAPIIQVNNDFYEDLDGPSTEALIDALKRGETPPMGSVKGRQTSAPEGGPTTLTDLSFAEDK